MVLLITRLQWSRVEWSKVEWGVANLVWTELIDEMVHVDKQYTQIFDFLLALHTYTNPLLKHKQQIVIFSLYIDIYFIIH